MQSHHWIGPYHTKSWRGNQGPPAQGRAFTALIGRAALVLSPLKMTSKQGQRGTEAQTPSVGGTVNPLSYIHLEGPYPVTDPHLPRLPCR